MPGGRWPPAAITGKVPILREPPNNSRVSMSHGRWDQKRKKDGA
jgi:hypothetical protein